MAALPEQADKVIHELRRQGFTGRIIGSQLFADPNTGKLFGKDGDGVLLMTGFWPGSSPEAADFETKFIAGNAAKGIVKAGAFHTDAQSYDIVTVLKTAMLKAAVHRRPGEAGCRAGSDPHRHGGDQLQRRAGQEYLLRRPRRPLARLRDRDPRQRVAPGPHLSGSRLRSTQLTCRAGK